MCVCVCVCVCWGGLFAVIAQYFPLSNINCIPHPRLCSRCLAPVGYFAALWMNTLHLEGVGAQQCFIKIPCLFPQEKQRKFKWKSKVGCAIIDGSWDGACMCVCVCVCVCVWDRMVVVKWHSLSLHREASGLSVDPCHLLLNAIH